MDSITELIKKVDEDRIVKNLFHLAKDPLPYRKLNYTLPGHPQNTLYEADDFIENQLKSCGYKTEKEGCRVQAYRLNITPPKHAQHGRPQPDDPWYTAYNLYARKTGTTCPDEIIVVVSHKDSQSWVDSPGAYDNCIGTVGNMEVAKVLADYDLKRSICFLFCNEEHTPWTSEVAAQNAKARGDNIIAVFNLDGIGGKSKEEADTGIKTNVTRYVTDEGEKLADLMAEVNSTYDIGLTQRKFKCDKPNDDDGSFIKAGYNAAVTNIGSFPYADPNYHAEGDIPELVDTKNAKMAIQATLAAILKIDEEGLC